MTKSDRDAVIEHIGTTIYELRDIADKAGEALTEIEIRERNAEGWTIDICLPGGTYHDERSFTRLEEITLSEAELTRALAYADDLIEIAEPWRRQLRILHGGDQRHKNAPGMTWDEIAGQLGISPSTLYGWLNGRHEPSPLARNAIAGLLETITS